MRSALAYFFHLRLPILIAHLPRLTLTTDCHREVSQWFDVRVCDGVLSSAHTGWVLRCGPLVLKLPGWDASLEPEVLRSLEALRPAPAAAPHA